MEWSIKLEVNLKFSDWSLEMGKGCNILPILCYHANQSPRDSVFASTRDLTRIWFSRCKLSIGICVFQQLRRNLYSVFHKHSIQVMAIKKGTSRRATSRTTTSKKTPKKTPINKRTLKITTKKTPRKPIPKKTAPKNMSSKNTSSMRSSPAWTYPNADVRLKLTPTFYAHVNSKAMSEASPVWRKFIFPPWRTDTQLAELGQTRNRDDDEMQPVEELDFTDDNDNAYALLMLLNMAHGRTQDLSLVMLSFPELVKIAILSNKYICMDVAAPWVKKWTGDGGMSWSAHFRYYRNDSNTPYYALEMMLFGLVFRANRFAYFESGAWWV